MVGCPLIFTVSTHSTKKKKNVVQRHQNILGLTCNATSRNALCLQCEVRTISLWRFTHRIPFLLAMLCAYWSVCLVTEPPAGCNGIRILCINWNWFCYALMLSQSVLNDTLSIFTEIKCALTDDSALSQQFWSCEEYYQFVKAEGCISSLLMPDGVSFCLIFLCTVKTLHVPTWTGPLPPLGFIKLSCKGSKTSRKLINPLCFINLRLELPEA